MNKRLVAISDIHGNTPELPQGDMLLIGGDLCPTSNAAVDANWVRNVFNPWLAKLPIKHKIATPGNHDFLMYSSKFLMPELNCVLLEDKTVTVDGVKIHGSPWSMRFGSWAYMLSDRELQQKWQQIPKGLDILLLHGPPHGTADVVHTFDGYTEHMGSRTLIGMIKSRQPRVVVCGHIHNGYGIYEIDKDFDPNKYKAKYLGSNQIVVPKNSDKIYIVHASLLDDNYDMVNKPMIIDLEVEGSQDGA